VLYRCELTVPAGTTEADPEEAELGVAYGTITRVRILFPVGCSGKVRAVVLYQGRQVFPLSSDASFLGDGDPLEFVSDVEVEERPYTLVLQGWAPDASYDHTVYFTFEMSLAVSGIPMPLGSLLVEVPEFEEV